MAVKFERVRPKPPPLPAINLEKRCVVCGCRASHSVGHSFLKKTEGTWYCATHFWTSPAGVDMALRMQAEANLGADVEEGETDDPGT